jgi:ABC-type sulfate transport system permease component
MSDRSAALRLLPTVGAAILSASLIGLFVLPLVALVTFATPAGLAAEFRSSAFWASFDVTLLASGIAVGLSLLLGVPLGFLLARRRFPGRDLVRSAVTLPVVVPHLVVGIALLLVTAPATPVGRILAALGISAFDSLAAVVLVMLYVGASYTVLASELAFRTEEEGAAEAVRSLGATPTDAFLDVTLPSAASGIATGALLTWARGISEIGGFLILASAVYPGGGWSGAPTAPASVYIYNLYSAGSLHAAAAAASLLVLFALAGFVAVRLVERSGRLPWRRGALGP